MSVSIRQLVISFIISCIVLPAAPAHADDTRLVLAERDDAYVLRDTATREWTIGSAGLELVLGFDADGTLALKRLWRPENGRFSALTAGVEIGITVAGEDVALQQAGPSVTFLRAAAEETETGVRLSLTFEHRASHALLTRSYAAYPGSPTFETWMHVETPSATSAVAISHLAGWRLTMPPASVKWVNGMRGETSATLDPATFDIQSGRIAEGAHFEIGSNRRSSEAFVPIIFAQSAGISFYGGVIWSGAWRISVDRHAGAMTVQADFPDIALAASADQPIEVPHAFFGVVEPFAGLESAALQRFVMRGIRQGRPFQPLVTYNSWFPHGARITESTMAEEVVRAAGLGVELFVMDAGWYEGAGEQDRYDFTSGLGSWTVDTSRFPGGLQPIVDLAHAHGMKFGLWVEPERVALGTVGAAGLAREEWLATQDGSYGDENSAQLCLASEAGRQWVFDRIVELIDAVRPDYLKWDNNFWINCDRDGHGHTREGGSYAHVVALYEMLGELRRRYPDMLIENVSGGGNRLDYGMLAYSDVGWMDDRTAPSALVRHNLQGLVLAFPPPYLLSFVIDSEAEPLAGGDDFAQIARSRMPGILGVTYAFQALDPALSGDMRREIEHYKMMRETIADSHAFLLSPQASLDEGHWDVLEELSHDAQRALLFAFKGTDDEGRLLVKPLNLLPDATYSVESLDAGSLGRLTGQRLMREGLELAHLEGHSRAHVIILRADPDQ